MNDLVAVVMAGGSGTRFWPLSTPSLPKQFITAFEERSLFQQTLDRIAGFIPAERQVVVSNRRFADIIRGQAPEIPPRNVLLEPCRRDTAAAVTLAAVVAERVWPGCTIVVMPSDHRILDREGFRRSIELGVEKAREGSLVTIGVPPTYPATGYGYLHVDGQLAGDAKALRLHRFVEKPNEARAREFLESGEFLWNSGIFVWKATTILDKVRQYLPDLHAHLSAVAESHGSPEFDERVAEAFDAIEGISIDYGVMEKAPEVWAVPALFDWSDVGGWLAAKDFVPVSDGGNRVRGDVVVSDCAQNLVIAEGEGHKVLCVGVEGLVVVSTPHGTLVCPEDRIESIKPQVEELLRGPQPTNA